MVIHFYIGKAWLEKVKGFGIEIFKLKGGIMLYHPKFYRFSKFRRGMRKRAKTI